MTLRIGQNEIEQSSAAKDSAIISPNEILLSWKHTITLQQNSEAAEGLRPAQLGAVYAIKSHWTISKEPATIVMPTGTGKTETMIVTVLTECCFKTLVIVPTQLLRDQTAERFANLTILKKLGIVSNATLCPAVALLKSTPESVDELNELLEKSNVLVCTMRLLNNFTNEFILSLNEKCSHLIVDEAHHVAAPTWNHIKNKLHKLSCIQFTATPFRNDGKHIDGKIIYNFPLSHAQRDGYFQSIDFYPIYEFDEQQADMSISINAIKKLEDDIESGYDHIVLVRARSKQRAELLHKDIYMKYYSKYNPVVIHSDVSVPDRKKRLGQLSTLNSRILICVDMFGEGIDIPNLKIAAVHDKYMSLPITLQFIGRFARTNGNIGNASFIANIANNEISESINELYSHDSDWNALLHIISDRSIGKELSLQELFSGFSGSGIKGMGIQQLRPKVSMIAFDKCQEEWRWDKWNKVFDEENCFYYVNHSEKILAIVEMESSNIDWSMYRGLKNVNWKLHLAYWNKIRGVLYVNTPDKELATTFAEALFPSPQRISGESVFRCLDGINRLLLGTVGLKSAINGPIRFRMFAGVDIASGISEAEKENSYKSNLFGIGYDGNGKISIGCSYKGTVWSRWVESIDYWRKWCDNTGNKLLNSDISVSEVFKGALIPEIVTSRPTSYPYAIEWSTEIDIDTTDSKAIEYEQFQVNLYNSELKLIEPSETGTIRFSLVTDEFSVTYSYIIDSSGFKISPEKGRKVFIVFKKKKILLEEYWRENSPIIRFSDQSILDGNVLIKSRDKDFELNKNIFESWDWSKTNIQSESQGHQKLNNSIQYAVIENLKSQGNHEIIFDDDGNGEIADIVCVSRKDNSISFDVYHCKYSSESKPGKRLKDLYEVCGQAEKAVRWMQDPRKIIERMLIREAEALEKNYSRIELGSLRLLREMRNRLRICQAKMNMYIVQPGIKADDLSGQMARLIAATENYLKQTYGIPLKVICSK